MSWKTADVLVGHEQVRVALDFMLVAQGQEGTHIDEAIEAAKKAIVGIVRSGAVGNPGDIYRVSASGHANPDHRSAEGRSNDFVTVSVTQAFTKEEIEAGLVDPGPAVWW